MRVLYDISTLGLGQRYVQSRGGSYRADRHLTEGLAASGECELLFCANHSSVAYEGSVEYLPLQPRIGHVPLLSPRDAWLASQLRRIVLTAHRWTRHLVGSHVLPPVVRHGGALLDRRIHPPVGDASPPVDVFHSPGTPLPPRAQGRRVPKRFLTIYDLSYSRFPGIYGPAHARAGRAATQSVLGDDWLMTSSEFTRMELCDRGVAPAERIFVSPLAADRATFYPCLDAGRIAAVRAAYGIPHARYILSVNSPDPRKNVPHAVRAFARFVQQEHVRDVCFVLTGNNGPGLDAVLQAIESVPGFRERVVVTGYVADSDLAALYSGATVFVYPSIYEGFGLPPLEAMQCGTPVITSRTSSLPEVVGDAGLMVSPSDLDALSGAMLQLHHDASLRAQLREKCLARAARFSWERTTRQVLAAYRTALAS